MISTQGTASDSNVGFKILVSTERNLAISDYDNKYDMILLLLPQTIIKGKLKRNKPI